MGFQLFCAVLLLSVPIIGEFRISQLVAGFWSFGSADFDCFLSSGASTDLIFGKSENPDLKYCEEFFFFFFAPSLLMQLCLAVNLRIWMLGSVK